MNALQTSVHDLQLLGVPCNQFGLQEPGDNGTEIYNSLKYVRPGDGFVPNFNLTEKIDVNGKNEHPMYTYLKEFCPPSWDDFAPPHRLMYEGHKANDIRWNFEKFLLDRNGVPILHYSETYHPDDLQRDIRDLLMETGTF